MIDPRDCPSECITPNCGKQCGYINGVWHGGRGLCKQCHAVASLLVKKKKTTWGELERLGLCKPKKEISPFLAAFEAKKTP